MHQLKRLSSIKRRRETERERVRTGERASFRGTLRVWRAVRAQVVRCASVARDTHAGGVSGPGD